MFSYIFLFSFFFNCFLAEVQVVLDNKGSYDIQIDGTSWLKGQGAGFRNGGSWYSSWNGSLKLANPIFGSSSSFILKNGSQSYKWSNDKDEVQMVTTISLIDSVVLFEQEFPFGFDGAQYEEDLISVVTAFPVFDIPSVCDDALGYYSFTGNQLGWEGSSGKFCAEGADDIPKGLPSGPIILFDRNMTKSLILSSASNFMIGTHSISSSPLQVQFGLLGSLKSVPPGFKTSFMLSVGNGVNDAVSNWGIFLRNEFQTDRSLRPSDFTLNYLGYSTDNGAYYYYKTEGQMNYEDTLLAVKQHVDDLGIPIRHVLLDSWWYYKDLNLAVTNWTSMPDIFPHGLQYLHEKTGWKFQGHNRYWSAKNVYSTENGGNYKFLTEGDFSLPSSSDFWNDLFRNSSAWGLSVYEQDWLYVQLFDTLSILDDIDSARNWLLEMGKGAQRNGITIQYCMAYHRHLQQSLEVTSVTQIRASEDYMLFPDQWKIGTTSMLINALGLAPSKDSSWSTSVQPGANNNVTERQPELQAALMTFSTGPVTFSDRINYFNKTLIMRSCALDGRILKPSVPMMSIDAMFISRAFRSGGTDGEVYASHSSLGDITWHHLLSAELLSPYSLKFSDIEDDDQKYLRYTPSFHKDNSTVLQDENIHLNAVDTTSFELYHFAPVLTKNGFTFLGEVDKWVPVSPQRFQLVSRDDTSITLRAFGVHHEILSVGLFMDTLLISKYTFPESGQFEFTVGEADFQSFTQ